MCSPPCAGHGTQGAVCRWLLLVAFSRGSIVNWIMYSFRVRDDEHSLRAECWSAVEKLINKRCTGAPQAMMIDKFASLCIYVLSVLLMCVYSWIPTRGHI